MRVAVGGIASFTPTDAEATYLDVPARADCPSTAEGGLSA